MSNISSVNDSFFSPQKIHILRNNGNDETGHGKKKTKEIMTATVFRYRILINIDFYDFNSPFST